MSLWIQWRERNLENSHVLADLPLFFTQNAMILAKLSFFKIV